VNIVDTDFAVTAQLAVIPILAFGAIIILSKDLVGVSRVVTALLVGGLIFIIFRYPDHGLVLLPMTTLLLPQFAIGTGLDLGINLVVIPALTIAAVRRNPQITLPRGYTLVFVGIFCIGLLAGFRQLARGSVTEAIQGIAYLGQWLLYLGLPLVVSIVLQGTHPEQRQQVRQATIGSLFIASVLIFMHLIGVELGFLPAVAGGEVVEGYAGRDRLRTFWGQGPNVVGLFLVSLILVSTSFAHAIPSKKHRVIFSSVALVSVSLFPFTFSRSALVGFLVGGGFLLLFTVKRYLLPTVAAGSLLIAVLPDYIRRRFFSALLEPKYITSLDMTLPVGPLDKRLNLWVGALQTYTGRPLGGWGFFVTAVDNTYLNLFIGLGISGLILTLVLFLLLFRACLSAVYPAKQQGDGFETGIAMGAGAALLSLYSWAFFSEMFARWRILGVVFILAGLAASKAWSPETHSI
jgi:multidrug transporter EmrE-like cation transporter